MRLNPRKIPIIGYETPANKEMLTALMIAMIEGDTIPPVELYQFDTLQVPYPGTDRLSGAPGGHHRLLAGYLLGQEVPVRIVEKIAHATFRQEIPMERRIPLDQIKIESDPKTYLFEKEISTYRALPNPETFFAEYGKVNLAFKYGTHTDYRYTAEAYKDVHLFQ